LAGAGGFADIWDFVNDEETPLDEVGRMLYGPSAGPPRDRSVACAPGGLGAPAAAPAPGPAGRGGDEQQRPVSLQASLHVLLSDHEEPSGVEAEGPGVAIDAGDGPAAAGAAAPVSCVAFGSGRPERLSVLVAQIWSDCGRQIGT
jgi:hypothetical protein